MSTFKGFGIGRRDVLLGTGAVIALPFTANAQSKQQAEAAPLAMGRRQTFDFGWRFLRQTGDFQGAEVDETNWRTLDLPHDWSIENLPNDAPPDRVGPFDKSALGAESTGFTIGGEGWYRKHFRLGAIAPGARVEIAFEGIAVTADIWLNGVKLGSHVHAYAPFFFDLTPHLNAHADNVIAVRVRNLGRNSRWYAGSGIYRSVTIDITPAEARFERSGVAASTLRLNENTAKLLIVSRVATGVPGTTVRTSLRSEAGKVVASVESPADATTEQYLDVSAPRLWSPSSPNLYVLESELHYQGRALDRIKQDFGIRIVTMDAEQGLRINGERTVLRGGCIHHDNGILGAIALADADERRVRNLKDRGFNAIRSSHNPSSRSLRHACDRLGMLLIEEAFDAWHLGKLPDDYARYFASNWQDHLEAMVLAARNSPSVIMWSIGNEIPDRNTPIGVEWQWKLANAVHALDPTRPVTAGINQWIGHPMKAEAGTSRVGHENEVDSASTIFLDVAGYNYRLGYIEKEHHQFPKRIIVGSETFPKDAYDYAELAKRAPYMLGEFVWTAMDYLGEVGIGAAKSGPAPAPVFPPVGFPEITAFCGDIDLVGQQKPQSFWRDVVWGLSPLEVLVRRPLPEGHVEWLSDWGWSDELATWTWAGNEGRPMRVRLYTSGDRAAVLLNGQPVGERRLSPSDKMRAELDVPYSPGTLEVVAWRDGQEIGRRQLNTNGTAARLRISPERSVLRQDRHALAFLGIEVLDGKGDLVLQADPHLRVKVDGEAELVAFGSANPHARDSLKSPEAHAWHGRALAVLRSTGRAGPVRIEVNSPGLKGSAVMLRSG